MKNLTNLEILETLSINHKKLKEDKPLLFHNILKAMDKAKSQAINYTRCCKSDSELLVFNEWKPKINFTKDKKYTIHSESDDKYLVQTDFGSIAWMEKKYFDKVMIKN